MAAIVGTTTQRKKEKTWIFFSPTLRLEFFSAKSEPGVCSWLTLCFFLSLRSLFLSFFFFFLLSALHFANCTALLPREKTEETRTDKESGKESSWQAGDKRRETFFFLPESPKGEVSKLIYNVM